MPIQSKAQWGFLAANHPDLLHKWQHEAPRVYSKLPMAKKPDSAPAKLPPLAYKKAKPSASA